MSDNDILKMYTQERQQCECWTRVMGYFRPYTQFNKGKQSEFKERRWFTEDHCACTETVTVKAA